MYVCLGRICIILPGCFSLLPPHACFLFTVQFLPVLLPLLLFLPSVGTDYFWNWRKQFLKAHYLSWIILLFRTVFPESSKQIPEQAKVCSQKCIVDPTFYFVPLLSGSQTPPSCHRQRSTSATIVPCFQGLCPAERLSSLIHRMCQDVESSRLQKHPGLLMLGCVVPTAGMAVAKVPHEDRSLPM